MCDPQKAWDWSEAHRHCLREARRHTANQHDAEEVAQDALLRAWRGWDSLRDPDAMWSWLAAITRNEAIRMYERTRPELRAELPERADEGGIADQVAVRLDVRRALSQLPERDQQLVALRYGSDLTCEAAAHALDLHPATAKVRLHRLHRRLAVSLARSYGT
jgi:RNA polymerase sigma-70 factor (ECF subfamily)